MLHVTSHKKIEEIPNIIARNFNIIFKHHERNLQKLEKISRNFNESPDYSREILLLKDFFFSREFSAFHWLNQYCIAASSNIVVAARSLKEF